MPRSESPYAACIRVASAWRPEFDVRHVEAFMRLDRPALDGLDIPAFEREVALAVLALGAEGPAAGEALAQSFGL